MTQTVFPSADQYERGEIQKKDFLLPASGAVGEIHYCRLTAADHRKGFDVVNVVGVENIFHFSPDPEFTVEFILERLPMTWDKPKYGVQNPYFGCAFKTGEGCPATDIIIFDGVEYSYNRNHADGPVLEIKENGVPKLLSKNGVVYNIIVTALGIYDCGLNEALGQKKQSGTYTLDESGRRREVIVPCLDEGKMGYKKPIKNVVISGNIDTIDEEFLSAMGIPKKMDILTKNPWPFDVESIDLSRSNIAVIRRNCFHGCEKVREFKVPDTLKEVYQEDQWGACNFSPAVRILEKYNVDYDDRIDPHTLSRKNAKNALNGYPPGFGPKQPDTSCCVIL